MDRREGRAPPRRTRRPGPPARCVLGRSARDVDCTPAYCMEQQFAEMRWRAKVGELRPRIVGVSAGRGAREAIRLPQDQVSGRPQKQSREDHQRDQHVVHLLSRSPSAVSNFLSPGVLPRGAGCETSFVRCPAVLLRRFPGAEVGHDPTTRCIGYRPFPGAGAPLARGESPSHPP